MVKLYTFDAKTKKPIIKMALVPLSLGKGFRRKIWAQLVQNLSNLYSGTLPYSNPIYKVTWLL